ncbi:MAG: MFS transporter [Rubellimicrobium sp.]|nr:MFS transporter [Rubellimicrobium sp.]
MRLNTLLPVLIGSSVIMLVNFGIRSSFGVFQLPVASEFGWPRAEFSMAIAIQNLGWGIGQPIFGAIADRFGDRKAILLGALAYAGGLLLSAGATQPFALQAYEMIVGFGIAGTGFGVLLAVVGRAAPEESRALALAVASAAGSAGQVLGPPVAEGLLALMPWQGVFVTFAGIVLGSMLFLPLLPAPTRQERQAVADEGMVTILRRALRDPSYAMIFMGFFSCGYQLAFITAHFPAFVTESCSPIEAGSLLASLGIGSTGALGAVAISVIGVANVIGTLGITALAAWWPRKFVLAGIYAMRTVVAAWFILSPMSPATVLLFSALMGALWLPTVPLTSGLIAHLWGPRYMATLYGLVFFSHQLGGFLGVWLGGRLYDMNGSYHLVWWVGIGVGAFSALIHLPIRENRATPVPA